MVLLMQTFVEDLLYEIHYSTNNNLLDICEENKQIVKKMLFTNIYNQTIIKY